MKKIILSIAIVLLSFQTTDSVSALSCQTPYVEYQGQCVDPIPGCADRPKNSTSCIDKIENGQRIPRFSFTCLPGYVKTGSECVDPIPACANPPKNSTSCIDKIVNGKRISRFSFTCLPDYEKTGNECFPIGEPNLGNNPIPRAGFEDEVITNPENYQNPFPDTNNSRLEGKAAAELYRRGVLGGYPDGEFKGSRTVNRAEAAKFLLLARYANVDELRNTGRFKDVLEGEWYVKFIIKAANLGILEGYSDGNFRPQNSVNTAEFLKMLTLTFGLDTWLEFDYSDVKSTDWFAKYAGTAAELNLFPNRTTNLEPGRELTRNEVAVAIYQYLKNRPSLYLPD